MNRIVHFEIYADDLIRASTFYKNVFGWKFEKYAGPMEYWMIETGDKSEPGINGGMLKRTDPIKDKSIIAFVCTIDVVSVDDTIKMIKDHGGSIISPKSAITGYGWMAYCKDTEGNQFGLMQMDKNAE